jgi:hypothetical protein
LSSASPHSPQRRDELNRIRADRRRLTSVVPGAGFSATGDGTVTVQGTGNTIFGNGSGAALNVANTTIGASGLTFQSISAGAASGSAGNGITLDNTGASGGLTVTGTGTAGHAAAFAATASVSMASSDTLGKDDLRSSVQGGNWGSASHGAAAARSG